MNLARGYIEARQREKARDVLERWIERKLGNQTALRALAALESK
jgi:hypothetical protein